MENLVGVERTVNTYSNDTKELLKERGLKISIEDLRTIVTPKAGDELFQLIYPLNISQVFALNNYLSPRISPDFVGQSYSLVCKEQKK